MDLVEAIPVHSDHQKQAFGAYSASLPYFGVDGVDDEIGISLLQRTVAERGDFRVKLLTQRGYGGLGEGGTDQLFGDFGDLPSGYAVDPISIMASTRACSLR